MKTLAFAGALTSALLLSSALTPARAADMTHDRALNVSKEPHNWLLHHGNYEGWRFSQLKQIDLNNIKNMKVAFTVALGGYQSGGRYPHGNLQATPIVEDGMMYVTDGWGSVYAIDVTSGKKGQVKWKFDPATDRAWAGDVACCGVNNRGVALWKDKIISISLDGRLFSLNKATGEMIWERKVADPAVAETLTLAPLVVRDVGIVGVAGGEFGVRGWIDGTDLNTGKQLWRTYTIPGAGRARQRHLEGRQGALQARRRLGLGDRHLRRRNRHVLSGHRQCRPRLGSGIPARRQQMGGERARAQPRRRQDQVGLPVHAERSVRLRRDLRSIRSSTRKVNGAGPQAGRARRAQRLLLRARPHQRLVRRRQAVRRPVELDDRARPRRPACRSTTIPTRTCRSTRRRATARAPTRRRTSGSARRTSAARTGSPPPTIPSSICSTSRRSKAATRSRRWSRRTSSIRAERSSGASASPAAAARPTERLYGSLKAVDPVTGETKARLKLDYPNYSGALATAGNLVFIGQLRRHVLGA